MTKVAEKGRIQATANSVQFRSFVDDFPISITHNLGTDTITGSFNAEKLYVVLTNPKVVARCLQEYGAVNTDNAGGNALYAEHLCAKPGLTWEGLLDPFAISAIPASCYRVLKLGEIIHGGMTREPVK